MFESVYFIGSLRPCSACCERFQFVMLCAFAHVVDFFRFSIGTGVSSIGLRYIRKYLVIYLLWFILEEKIDSWGVRKTFPNLNGICLQNQLYLETSVVNRPLLVYAFVSEIRIYLHNIFHCRSVWGLILKMGRSG